MIGDAYKGTTLTLTKVSPSDDGHLSRFFAFLDRNADAIALYAGGVVQVYLMLLAIDSMYIYGVGISLASPYIRAGSLIVIGILLLRSLVTKAFEWDAMLVALIAFAIVPSIIGLLSGSHGYIFGRQMFAALMMATCYWLGLYLREISSLEKGFKIVALATAAGCLVFILVAALNGFLGRAYTSLTASIPMLFSLDFALLRTSPMLLAACLTVVLITNLRMGVMGASIMVGTYLSFRFIKRPIYRLISAPVLALAIFALALSAIFVANKVGTSIAGISIGERATRTFEALAALLPRIEMNKGMASSTNKVDVDEVLESVGTNRLSQSVAVFNAVNKSPLNLLLGPGFGAEYRWDYYSSYEQAWQHYVLNQTDMMIPYFLLMGGVFFATLLPLLILWRSIRVYINLLPGMRLGGLFVLGFGSTMFFGFQPNVPLYWLLLGALSRPVREKGERELSSRGARS